MAHAFGGWSVLAKRCDDEAMRLVCKHFKALFASFAAEGRKIEPSS